ncbi:superfamily II DNA/RNA helicase [Sulfuritortus calidifontis]|uniref:DEAD-box ATP-dependent RNA helicase RhpA n=1 Tax=Sulfuritortus calidifontis TaxID=1914471 RepID=A0A4R3JZ09_9PROT|nr:DEAD/DEAH box helicase [Sulfuritortus calidifontis]TCS73954.1 superfamily II DNA/RNA helicase [Sulfuritortus calidifontis]
MSESSALEAASSFAELNLSPEIQRALDDMGYQTPTPIQKQAIPLVLAGRDLMAQAQTGTGKTAAFALPLLQKMQPFANTSTSPARHPVRALVLAPTRELAIQVYESVVAYGKHIPLRSTVVYGGVGLDTQTPQLRAGVEVLVATPGRLLDHAGSRVLSLAQVEYLVLDEADRMLDMGFLPDLKRILSLLPQNRQTLLFSATFDDSITRLAQSFLRDPLKVEVARRNTAAETVEQVVHKAREEEKIDALVRVVSAREISQAIVFTRTKLTADRLGRQLQRRSLEVAVIHGDKAQSERLLALEGFKQGKTRLLVATDIAARGLDIAELPCVINFELPYSPEDYVHRIGRTGRAGAEGLAVSLVAPDEEKLLAAIEKFINKSLPAAPLPKTAAPVAPSWTAPAAPVVPGRVLAAAGPRGRRTEPVCALLLPPVRTEGEASPE